MPLLLVLLAFVANMIISWWNCRAVGTVWYETKEAGGFIRLVAWAGATMAAAGFTWCYLLIAGVLLAQMGKLDQEQLELFFSAGYLLVIVFVVPSGLLIMLYSWKNAFHEKTVGGYVAASYNTFANGYNVYNAVSGVPSAFKSLTKGLNFSRNSKDAGGIFLLLLVLAVALAGVITTVVLIRHYASRTPLEELHPEREYQNPKRFV
jgi:hypothetical protein